LGKNLHEPPPGKQQPGAGLHKRNLKGNQGALYGDVKLYFDDPALRAGCAYRKAADKARSAVEIREYRQTTDIMRLQRRKARAGLASVVMVKNTIIKDGDTASETRYFISSLPLNA
jgi:hypothetical protein